MKSIIDGNKSAVNITEADAPTSLNKIKKVTEKIILSSDPIEYIQRNGINLDKIYLGLYDIALNAETMAKDRDGDCLSLGPDNRSRIMASTLLLELAKHIKDKNVIIAQGIFNDPKIKEAAQKDADRIISLRKNL